MENVYTEELMVLLEGMDLLMASHVDVNDDVHVQVKQGVMENAMSDYDMTRCLPPRGIYLFVLNSTPSDSFFYGDTSGKFTQNVTPTRSCFTCPPR
jgi:hypothetical protein